MRAVNPAAVVGMILEKLRILEVKTLVDGRVVTVYAPGAKSSKPINREPDRISVISESGKALRNITSRQARQLIQVGLAFPLSNNLGGELPGWRDRKTYPLVAIKLSTSHVGVFSPCAITVDEARANAGEWGEQYAWVKTIKDKIDAWPKIFDTKAARVGIRTPHDARQ